MADLLRKYKSNYSSTTNSFSTGTGETITPNSVSGLPTDTEIILTLDRVDSEGTETPTKMERIIGTISGGNFVIRTSPSSGRGADGSTEQAHTSPVVEMVWNAKDWNDLVDWGVVQHDQAGAHTDITASTITASTVSASAIIDNGGNEVLITPATASAVNEITVANAATGNAPGISATGGDTNIDLALTAKGTGKILQDAHYQTPQTYTPAGGATATLDLSKGNEHRITMPAGNITIAISNETNGQKFIVSILQDGTGSRIATFWSTIKWAGGSAPTLTTTADKRDVFGFIVTGTDTYDGFTIGANV